MLPSFKYMRGVLVLFLALVSNECLSHEYYVNYLVERNGSTAESGRFVSLNFSVSTRSGFKALVGLLGEIENSEIVVIRQVFPLINDVPEKGDPA